MCNEINIDDFRNTDNDSILDLSSKDFFVVCCYCGVLMKREKSDKLIISHGICSNCMSYVEEFYLNRLNNEKNESTRKT